jgi:replication factor C small subunit
MKEVWVEKYRPKILAEVVGQNDITERLKAYAEIKSMPHLLFAGPAGTGKTTCAIALAREVFGEDWKANFLELNASDERGIQIVRTKIKEYARIAPMGDTGFKIIFLDEADALTPEAQAALRRTMERYTQTCRFILSCNYSSKIIEPIQSRCAVFRFRPLSAEDIKNYLLRIAKVEGKEISDDGLDALVYLAEGDCRKATNSLQVAATMGDKIDANMIYRTASLSRP